MVSKRLLVAAVGAGALALAAAPTWADGSPYTGPGVVAQCAGAPLVSTGVAPVDQAAAGVTSPTAFGVGAACFRVPATTASGTAPSGVTVSVTDANGGAVPFSVQYQEPNGQTSSATTSSSCTGSGTFAFPSDITSVGYVYVFVDDPASATVSCGAPSVATTGNITVTWS